MKKEETEFIEIEDIREGQRIRGRYLVREKRVARTKNGKPFVSMILADKTGTIEAKVWDRANELASLFNQGDVIDIVGLANPYRGHVQLNVVWLRPVPEEEIDLGMFMESSPFDPDELLDNLKGCLSGIGDIHLKRLVNAFWQDETFMEVFKQAPAAKKFHHNYRGGLLEHTLSVCRLAVLVSDHYSQLNRDILIAGAFFHDIGKVRELETGPDSDYTDEGRLLGHVVLGLSMLEEKIKEIEGFPFDLSLRLKHLILSHHGQFEYGSPKRPKFLEAFALNLIDDLDAKMNGLSRFMEKDIQEGPWTDFNRLFGRYLYKGD